MTPVADVSLDDIVIAGPRIARQPPETRGLARDGVRLMVVQHDGVEHANFHELARFLEAGDVVVVNASATIAAAADALRPNRDHVVVHFAAQPRGTWLAEVRTLDQHGPVRDMSLGDRLVVADGGEVVLEAPVDSHRRFWRIGVKTAGSFARWLEANARPISYSHGNERWPLSAYQTVFGRHPGSSEMPSAGRPFSTALVTDLVARGIVIAPIVLHTGLSSLEIGEAPPAEWFDVPRSTARIVNACRRGAGRVVAVGTTVVRALESAAGDDGAVVASSGWTDLVLSPSRRARTIDALITGWHEPRSTHLELLAAVVRRDTVRRAYVDALAHGYLWHEFGDSCLFVAERD
ncbi:MAG: S-adenosylmethionine:tRNA ribosyltransferase-isomerase [Candidatus Dormibacteria bacterium]